MAQFDVYRNPNPGTRDRTPYLLDVQAGIMAVLPTRLVWPIRAAAELPIDPIDRIHVPVTIDGQDCVVFVSELTAVPVGLIATRAGSLAEHRSQIVAAIDLLVTGFL